MKASMSSLCRIAAVLLSLQFAGCVSDYSMGTIDPSTLNRGTAMPKAVTVDSAISTVRQYIERFCGTAAIHELTPVRFKATMPSIIWSDYERLGDYDDGRGNRRITTFPMEFHWRSVEDVQVEKYFGKNLSGEFTYYRVRVVVRNMKYQGVQHERFACQVASFGAEELSTTLPVFVHALKTLAGLTPAKPVPTSSQLQDRQPGTGSGGIEQQLQQLKALFDKGLITKDAYEAKQRQLLGL